MKTLLSAAICLTSLLHAQTTITKTFNDPTVGDVVNNVTLNGTVDNSAAGSNVTFNNSSLTVGSAVSNNYSAPTASEFSTYVGTTIKHFDGSNTIFYKQNPSSLEIVGIVNSSGTANFSANPAVAITYPTAYGSTFTDTVSGTAVFNGITVGLTGTVTTTADAAGTLLLSSSTFPNILRLKIVLNMNITLSGIPVGTMVNTMYMYFDNVRKYPLLNYTSLAVSGAVTQNSESAQAQSFIYLGTQESGTKPKFTFYPNPATDYIYLKTEENSLAAAVFTADGRLIEKVVVKDGLLNIASLQPGNYLVSFLNQKGQKTTFKFIKK